MNTDPFTSLRDRHWLLLQYQTTKPQDLSGKTRTKLNIDIVHDFKPTAILFFIATFTSGRIASRCRLSRLLRRLLLQRLRIPDQRKINQRPNQELKKKERRTDGRTGERTFHGAAQGSSHRPCLCPWRRCEPEPSLGPSPSGFRVEIWVKANKQTRQKNKKSSNRWKKIVK